MSEQARGRVLIVEDDRPTSNLMNMAIDEVSDGIECHDVRSAEAALESVSETIGSDREPDLILLDLDLPRMDGSELLETFSSNDDLRHLPVVVVSGNTSPRTVNACYELHARSFIEKPDHWEQFLDVARSIVGYWFETAHSPKPMRAPSTARDSTVEVE